MYGRATVPRLENFSSSATAFSRIGAASGAFFLPVIDAKAGLGAAFTVVAIASVLAAIITMIYLPETARCELKH